MRFLIAGLAATLLTLTGCVGGIDNGDTVQSTLHERLSLTPNASITISNVSGPIVVVPWRRRQIEIVAHKHASDLDALNRTTVSISHDATPATDVTIKTEYRHSGLLLWGNGGGSVDYTIHVPADVSLHVSDVSGDIHVRGIAGAVSISNVSGDVEALGLGDELHVSIVSGSVNASLNQTKDTSADLSSISGSLTLAIPPKSNATVSAASVSGSFDSPFPIAMQHHTVGFDAHGRLGNGSGTIEMNTVSGSLTLSKT